MLRLAGERTTHGAVKQKIMERMEEWTRMFGGNTELGIMEGALSRLKSQSEFLVFRVLRGGVWWGIV